MIIYRAKALVVSRAILLLVVCNQRQGTIYPQRVSNRAGFFSTVFVFGVVIQDIGARETETRCGSSRTPEVRCKAKVDDEPS